MFEIFIFPAFGVPLAEAVGEPGRGARTTMSLQGGAEEDGEGAQMVQDGDAEAER